MCLIMQGMENCVNQLIEITTAEETLIWVASSSVSQICSTFIIMIIIMIIILVQCCHNVLQGRNGVSRGEELPQAGRPSLQPMLTRIHYNIY